MAISKRPFIYATFILACGAIALNVTSFATQTWVDSALVPYDPQTLEEDDHINYGLFSGTVIRHILQSTVTSDLYLTCLYGENVCVWSCTQDKDARLAELTLLYEQGTSLQTVVCAASSKMIPAASAHKPVTTTARIQGLKVQTRADKVVDQQFINAALHICTIVFLAIALFFATVAAVMSVVNSAMSPTEPILSIYGLYIWNSIAAVSDLIVLILWGAHFALTLKHNVAYTEVVLGDVISDGHASLGYSYWIVIGATLLHLCNLGVLALRLYLINQEPPETNVQVDERNEGDIYLY